MLTAVFPKIVDLVKKNVRWCQDQYNKVILNVDSVTVGVFSLYCHCCICHVGCVMPCCAMVHYVMVVLSCCRVAVASLNVHHIMLCHVRIGMHMFEIFVLMCCSQELLRRIEQTVQYNADIELINNCGRKLGRPAPEQLVVKYGAHNNLVRIMYAAFYIRAYAFCGKAFDAFLR